jgi:2-phospho-L-lactate/phosphoenolpyruvate guanylyltransferase
MTGIAALLPVKAFHEAKVRLAPALDPDERERIARLMAERVLLAAAPLPTAVVCDDEDVARWAEGAGARVVWCPGHGLNGAVEAGVAALVADGVERVVVAHADLPLATDLDSVIDCDGVTLVPDRREDGTTVISLPAGCGFRFAYGPGSFARHRREVDRLGLPLHVVRERRLGWDVDVPEDLDLPTDLETEPLSPAFPGGAGPQ